MQSLNDKYSLSESQRQFAFERIVKYFVRLKNVVPVSHPRCVILGAQPGSGKTQVQNKAENLFFNNIVICNADLMRDFHPMSGEIKENHEAEYPALTADCSQYWRSELCQYCIKNKLNFIMETTFSSGEVHNTTFREIKKQGYPIDLMLLAVPRLISLLGTRSRYEDQKAAEKGARLVPLEAFDSRFNNLLPTIKIVEEAKLYDTIWVYIRSLCLEGDHSPHGVMLLEKNPASVYSLFRNFFEQMENQWPEKLTNFFKEECRRVLQLMTLRKASAQEIAAFKYEMSTAPGAQWMGLFN